MEERMSPIGLMLGSSLGGLMLVLFVPVGRPTDGRLYGLRHQPKQRGDFLNTFSWFPQRGINSIHIRPPPLFSVDL
jgi:hypothetical protein